MGDRQRERRSPITENKILIVNHRRQASILC
jgi:hypothetical protein